jgi:MATE family multidrug resistance protein
MSSSVAQPEPLPASGPDLTSTEDEAIGTTSGTLRELLRVAIPLIISQGSVSLMNIVDRMMLTKLSVEAVAASISAAMFHWTALGFPLGVAIYVNTFVAQYEGARRKDRVAASMWQGIWLAIGFGFLLILSQPLISWGLRSLGHEPEVTRLEVQYFSVLCWGSGPMLLSTTLSAFFSGRGHNSVVMGVNLVVSVLNAIMAYAMIFGELGCPQLGIRGAGLASVLASMIACVIFGAMIYRTSLRDGYDFRSQLRIDWELIRRMLRFGLPNGFQLLMDIAAWLMFTLIVGEFGTIDLAATTIAFNLNQLSFVPMLGLGTAVLTLVGRRIGEKRPKLAARTTWNACLLAEAYMLVFVVIYLAFPQTLLDFYATKSETLAEGHVSFDAVRPVVTTLLQFVAAYSIFDALAIVFGNAIRGAGDTRFSLIYTFCCGWFVMVVPCYFVQANIPWVKEHLASPLWLCWTAATLNIFVLGMGLMARFIGGRWQRMSVIEPRIDETLSGEPTVGLQT